MGAFGAVSGAVMQGAQMGMQIRIAQEQQKADNLARKWNATMMRQDAAYAQVAADQARDIGRIAANEKMIEADILRGRQRASYGASGVSVNVGSAAAVQADAMAWGRYSAEKEIYNAEIQAFQHEQSKRQLEAQAKMQEAGVGGTNYNAWAAGFAGVNSLAQTAYSARGLF